MSSTILNKDEFKRKPDISYDNNPDVYFTYDSSEDTFNGTTSGGVNLKSKGYVPLTGTTVGITIELIDVIFDDLNQNRTLFDIGDSPAFSKKNLIGYIDNGNKSVRFKTYGSNVRKEAGFSGLNDGNPHHIIFCYDDVTGGAGDNTTGLNPGNDRGYIVVDGTIINYPPSNNDDTTFSNELDLQGDGAYLGRNMAGSTSTYFNGSIGRINIYKGVKPLLNILSNYHTYNLSNRTTFTNAIKLNKAIVSDHLDISVNGSLTLPRLSRYPDNPVAGTIFYNTTTQELMGYNGSGWNVVSNRGFGNGITKVTTKSYSSELDNGNIEFYVEDNNGNSIKKLLFTEDGSMGVNYQNASEIINKVDISGILSCTKGFYFNANAQIVDNNNGGLDISFQDGSIGSKMSIDLSNDQTSFNITDSNTSTTKMLLKDFTMNINQTTSGVNRVTVNGNMSIGYPTTEIPANSLCVEEKVILNDISFDNPRDIFQFASTSYGINKHGNLFAKDISCVDASVNIIDISNMELNNGKIKIQNLYNSSEPCITIKPDDYTSDICFNCIEINDSNYGFGVDSDNNCIIRVGEELTFNTSITANGDTSGAVFDKTGMFYFRDVLLENRTHKMNMNNSIYTDELDCSNLDVSGNYYFSTSGKNLTIGNLKFGNYSSNAYITNNTGGNIIIKSEHIEFKKDCKSVNSFKINGIEFNSGSGNNTFEDISSLNVTDSTTDTLFVAKQTSSGDKDILNITDNNNSTLTSIHNNGVSVNTDSTSSILEISGNTNIYPIGAIMMIPVFMDVPPGWRICDGQNNTPYLIDHFPRGIDPNDANPNSNSTQGSNTIIANHIPSHTHNIDGELSGVIDICNNANVYNCFLLRNANNQTSFTNKTQEKGTSQTCLSQYIFRNNQPANAATLVGIDKFRFNSGAFGTLNIADASLNEYGNTVPSEYIPQHLPFKYIEFTGNFN